VGSPLTGGGPPSSTGPHGPGRAVVLDRGASESRLRRLRQRRRAPALRSLGVSLVWALTLSSLSLFGVLMIMRVSGATGS